MKINHLLFRFLAMLNFLLIYFISPELLYTQSKIWIGGTGNWDVATNWSPVGVPTSIDDILIENGSDVTIPSGFSAYGQKLTISINSILRIKNGAQFQVNGNGISDNLINLYTNSEIINEGTTKCGNLNFVFGTGVYIIGSSKLVNLVSGYFEISRASNGIVLSTAGSFINHGLLKIGNNGPISFSGIHLNTGTSVLNNATGTIEIDQTMGSAIQNFGSLIENYGNFNIGKYASILLYGMRIQNGGVLNNKMGATIEISNVQTDGILIQHAGSQILNSGEIRMGTIFPIKYYGLSAYTGSIIKNEVGALFQINDIQLNDGMSINNSGTQFINKGVLKLGNTKKVNRSGVFLQTGALLENHVNAILEINNISVWDALSIYNPGTVFTNSGKIKIGNLSPIKNNGIFIVNAAKFNNTATGDVEINNVAEYQGLAVLNTDSEFNNFGKLNIGNLYPINHGGIDLWDKAKFTNNVTGSIEVNNSKLTDGVVLFDPMTSFTNAGQLKIGNLFPHSKSCIYMFGGPKFTNLQGGFIEINNATLYDGIVMDQANTLFTNAGTINIGNKSSINRDGIGLYNFSGFVNALTGLIEINNTTTRNGIYCNSNSQIDNSGIIRIGNTSKIKNAGISLNGGSKFLNNTAGIIEIDSTLNNDAIQALGVNTEIKNNGYLKIGAKSKIGAWGIWLTTGGFMTNQINGRVDINNSSIGISISSATSSFTNQGIVHIGNSFGIRTAGISISSGQYFNQSLAQLNISNTGVASVSGNGIQLSSSSAIFHNYGGIAIGASGSIKSNGIQLSSISTFNNYSGSSVSIDNVLGLFAVLSKAGTTILNQGTLKFGFIGNVQNGIGDNLGTGGVFINSGYLVFKNVSLDGVYSNQTLTNNSGGTVTVLANGNLRIANLGVLNNAAGAFVNNFGTLTNNGIINNSGTFDNQNIYKGTGVFNTSLFSNPAAGTVAPGLSPGCLQFTNGLASLGKLEIEINGPVSCSDYDQIQVSGNALVGGNLYINFNYTPACGATFQLINASTHSGSFANIFITPNTITASYSNGILSILDVIAPSIICPSNVEYTTAPGDCGPVPSSEINLGSPVTSDNCGVAGTSNNAPSTYALGVKNVKWTVTDLSGNTNTCIQKVTIKAGTCGTPQQVYSTDLTQTSAKVKWNAGVPCATDYQLRLRYEISPGVWSSWSTWSNHSGPGLEHLFTGLSPNRYYHYQIRSKCGSATNSNSINGWFTTLPSGGSLKRIDNAKDKSYTDPDLLNNGSQRNISDLTLISVSPNPAKDWIILSISGFNLDEKQMSIIDLSGKLISSAKLQASENELEIDLLNLPSGIYYLRVSNATKQKTIQFVIEK